VAEQDVADDRAARGGRDQLDQHVGIGTQPLDQLPFVGALEGGEVDRPDRIEIPRPGLADGNAGRRYRGPPSPAAATSTSPSALAISRISLLRMA
jgi:hypothetical protein